MSWYWVTGASPASHAGEWQSERHQATTRNSLVCNDLRELPGIRGCIGSIQSCIGAIHPARVSRSNHGRYIRAPYAGVFPAQAAPAATVSNRQRVSAGGRADEGDLRRNVDRRPRKRAARRAGVRSGDEDRRRWWAAASSGSDHARPLALYRPAGADRHSRSHRIALRA